MALLSAFNPHEFSEATVRAVATGREKDLDGILATIRGNLDAATMQHLIVSAPRGYGKSFMMRHIQIEVGRVAREEGVALAAVLMPEEMPHVKEPETFIRELTRALTGGAGADAELTWHEDDGAIWDAAIGELETAVDTKVGARGLVVALVENFDVLLRRAFPKEVQSSRLRSFLATRSGRLMLIAASASGAFDRDYDNRLFQAFREVVLEPWSVEDCLAFFDRQRKDAGRAPLGEPAKARARAVASFIGGTPRLATLLGDALFDEDVLRAADLLQKLVDELTPYYKERIEALPGRSQKLLDALLRGGEPATQSEIARRVRANGQAAIAGPFNDLAKERVVVGERATGSAEVLYRVGDRVFAHYYRRRVVDHGATVCALEALVDLLAEYFSPQEKQTKAAEFARLGRIQEARLMARLHDAERGSGKGGRRWMLADLSRYVIPTDLLPFASSASAGDLRAIVDHVTAGEIDQAYMRIETASTSAIRPEDRVLLLLVRSTLDAYEGIDGGLAAADEALELATEIQNRRLELIAGLGRAWSLCEASRYKEALKLSLHTAKQAESNCFDLVHRRALRYAAAVLSKLGRHEEAVVTARQAAERARMANDVREEAAALCHVTFGLTQLGRHETAAATATEAAERARTADDGWMEAAALRRAAYSIGQLGRHDRAVATATRAAERARAVGDVYEEAASLTDVAFYLARLYRHEEAVATAKKAAKRARMAGDIRGEAESLNHAAFSLGKLGRASEAVAMARQAADRAGTAGALLEKAISLRLLTLALGDLYENVDAISAIAAGAKVLQEQFDDEESHALLATSARIGVQASKSLGDGTKDLEQLHTVLRAGAQNLSFDGLRRTLLRSWLQAFAKGALQRIRDPDRLDAWASAIELHFPERFGEEITPLRHAAGYHRSGHDRGALARLDPDLARTLMIMFPPQERNWAEDKRPRKASGKRKQ